MKKLLISPLEELHQGKIKMHISFMLVNITKSIFKKTELDCLSGME